MQLSQNYFLFPVFCFSYSRTRNNHKPLEFFSSSDCSLMISIASYMTFFDLVYRSVHFCVTGLVSRLPLGSMAPRERLRYPILTPDILLAKKANKSPVRRVNELRHPTAHLAVLRNPRHADNFRDSTLSPGLHNSSEAYLRMLENHIRVSRYEGYEDNFRVHLVRRVCSQIPLSW